MLSFSLLVLIAGCDGSKVADDTAADTAADTDTDTDTDTDSDTDTDTDTDPGTASLVFQITGDTTDAVLTLTSVDLTGAGSLGDTLATVTVSGSTATVVTGPAPDADLVEADPVNYPGLYVAYYVPALFRDGDGDLLPSTDDPYTAIGAGWPLYVTGVIPASLAGLGIVDGWNAVQVDLTDGTFVGLDAITGIPLAVNLAEKTEGSIGGTYGGSLDESTLGLAMVPRVVLSGTTVGSYLYDAPFSAPWAIAVSGAPPADHLESLSVGTLRGAYELPLTYVDADGSGGASDGDSLGYAACSGTNVAALFYIEPPGDLVSALLLSSMAMAPGWTPIVADETTSAGFSVLSDADAASLVMNADCSLM